MQNEQLTPSLIEKIKKLRYLILDVDGVLTDGTFIINADAKVYDEYKSFHAHDGYGMKLLQKHGVEIIIISGRKSRTVEVRMQQLAVEHVHLGIRNKIELFHNLCQELNMQPEQCGYVGDDLPDIEVMREVGVRFIVANATEVMHEVSDYQTKHFGGYGAVREVCDLIIKLQQEQ